MTGDLLTQSIKRYTKPSNKKRHTLLCSFGEKNSNSANQKFYRQLKTISFVAYQFAITSIFNIAMIVYEMKIIKMHKYEVKNQHFMAMGNYSKISF